MNGMNLFDDKKLKHYEGELGIFDYDPREFEIAFFCGEEYLHYCGNGKSVNLPDGCINTRNMFRECHLPVGFSLGDKFDTSRVISMEAMFSQCALPEGFSFGDRFDTSNVVNMHSMFFGGEISEGISLGDHFDTSNVTNMGNMFYRCPKVLTLGSSLALMGL